MMTDLTGMFYQFRSRTFNIDLQLGISQAIAAEIGGELIAEAKLGGEVEKSLGVKVGASETVQAQRTMETPADNNTFAKKLAK